MRTLAYLIDTIETPAAGTEHQLLTLIGGLDPARFRVRLFLLRDSDWTRQSALPHTTLGVRHILSLDLWRGLDLLVAAYRREPFDLLQTFFPDAGIVGALAARRLHLKPLVASRRNIGHWQSRRDRLILRTLRRWTSHYLANSRAAAEQVVATEHADPAFVSVIHNALDLERFAGDLGAERRARRQAWGVDDETTVIGAVANLRPVKNLGSLVKAAAAVGRNHRVACVLVGEGSERDALTELAAREGLGDRLILLGREDDVLPCLAGFDIAVLCSTHESFSNSLIEYMAAGKPIVASDVGGNREAIEHGRTGLLYDVLRPAELAERLERYIRDPRMASQLAASARDEATNRFARPKIMCQHEEFYDHIITDPNAPGPFGFAAPSRA